MSTRLRCDAGPPPARESRAWDLASRARLSVLEPSRSRASFSLPPASRLPSRLASPTPFTRPLSHRETSHRSSPRRDLIRAVRACKTSAEERALIAKESASIRGSLKDSDAAYRHRNVAKLMFMHMLGYPTHFGQMECVKLIAASGFAEKRVGYLGLMILLDERQEVTMLVTNSIKNDLAHKNHFVVGLALCSLGNICTAEMARDVAPEVAGLLSSKSSYVRKKAALCAIRVVKKVPELSDGFAAGASDLLADRHHGVLLCAVSLAIQLCRVDPAHLPTFRAHVPTLVRILKSLIHSGYSAEHDVGGHADPFLQAKLLRFLTVLGSGDAEASDQMSDVLANVASNTDGSKNAGCAILYEAVNAIVGVESIGGLRVLAVNILGRFLAGRDNNARYVALNALSKVVQRDAQAVQRHRHTIVECVKDSDVTIRRSALQLVYNLVNEKNIETLARELLEYLAVADEEFKGDLAKRISQLVATFAPNPRWHVDTMCDLLVRGGSHVADEECRAFVRLLTRAEEPLRGYAARALFRAACEERSHFQLLAVAAWVLGEYGDEGVGPGRLEGEPRTVVTKGDVCKLLESMLSDPHAPRAVRRVAVMSLAKLSARFPDELEGALRAAEKVSGSVDVELQQRASEFVRMFERGEPAARALLERMPPFEAEKNDPRSGGAGSGGASGGGGCSGAGATSNAANESADLLGDLMGLDDPAPIAGGGGAGAGGGGADLLGDLMSGSVGGGGGGGGGGGVGGAGPGTAAAPAAAIDPLAELMGGASLGLGPGVPSVAASDPLMDLMGGGLTAGGVGGAAAAAPALAVGGGGSGGDLLGDAFGSGASAVGASSEPHRVVAFASASGELTVAFECARANPSDPTTIVISASATNSGAAPARQFSLQAAVPKTMTLRLAPASGAEVPALGMGAVTQRIEVVNPHAGSKPLAMRLRVGWTDGAGNAIVEQATVPFPATL